MKLNQIAVVTQLNEEDDGPNDAGFESTRDIAYAVLPYLKNEIEKLNRRAKKIGSPIINMIVSAPFYKKVKKDGDEINEKYVTVEIDGEAPHVPGYDFLATIEHKSGGNVVRTVPGADESNVKQFYNAKPDYCDHCKKKRARIDTYIIRDQQTGELRQIGRNCLSDFLGGRDPKAVLWWFSLKDKIYNVLNGANEYEGKFRGRSEYAADRDRVLNTAAAIINHYGYVSWNSAQYGDRTATASIVKQLVFGPPPWPGDKEGVREFNEWKEIVKNSGPKEASLIDNALDWFKNELSDDEKLNNNFYHNIDVILKGEHVTRRDLGILIAIFPAYEKVKGSAEERKKDAKKSNEWVGKPGDKLPKTRITVTKTTAVANNFAYNAPDNQLVKMEDDDGNSYTWWNSSRNRLEEDGVYDIQGTIKKHDEYRGRKTTVLTRVKAVEV